MRSLLLSPWLTGTALSALIVSTAYWCHSLSRSGSVIAFFSGLFTFVVGGWLGSVLLVAFFFSSSLLSHWQTTNKKVAMTAFAKGGKRDAAQVLANGGLALAGMLLAGWKRGAGEWQQLGWLLFLATLATATADTWATEVGTLYHGMPRLLVNGRRVLPGTSGGVTWLGLCAAWAGATFISGTAWLGLALQLPSGIGAWHLSFLQGLLVLVAGFVGALFDSFLGATWQVQYFCPHCHTLTEKRVHSCGTPTQYHRGWRWLNNDWVNFLSTVIAGIVAIAGYQFLL